MAVSGRPGAVLFIVVFGADVPHTVRMKVIQNRRARFDYDIVETIEAGLMLTGQEVKACRDGHVDMGGSYVSFATGKPVIKNLKIMPYRFASGLEAYQPGHDRMLLLNKKEIEKLGGVMHEKGMSIIPLEVRTGRYVKLLIGLGKGRKSVDKRRVIKERDIEKRIKKGQEI